MAVVVAVVVADVAVADVVVSVAVAVAVAVGLHLFTLIRVNCGMYASARSCVILHFNRHRLMQSTTWKGERRRLSYLVPLLPHTYFAAPSPPPPATVAVVAVRVRVAGV